MVIAAHVLIGAVQPKAAAVRVLQAEVAQIDRRWSTAAWVKVCRCVRPFARCWWTPSPQISKRLKGPAGARHRGGITGSFWGFWGQARFLENGA
jgi:hypothetical protein